MTIGAWVLVVILGIIGIGSAAFYFLDDSKTKGIIAILITIIVDRKSTRLNSSHP